MAKDHKLSMLWVLCDTNKDHSQEYKMVDARDCKTKDRIVLLSLDLVIFVRRFEMK